MDTDSLRSPRGLAEQGSTASINTYLGTDAVELHSNQGTSTTSAGTVDDNNFFYSGDNNDKSRAKSTKDVVTINPLVGSLTNTAPEIRSRKKSPGDDDNVNDIIPNSDEDEDNENIMTPLVSSPKSNIHEIRSRKKLLGDDENYDDNYDVDDVNIISDGNNNNNNRNNSSQPSLSPMHIWSRKRERLRRCCDQISELQRDLVKNTFLFMNFMARVLFWASLAALCGAVFYYSKELYFHGTEPHLVAWFSAGAFVILGFPISIYGILMHLTNYYQPNIQCYVIRILWMVPIYSIESWLCLRFHEFAIYIETLRDVYESFVLYCFLQFLIEVLGGEESLILLLKDKSPTRGFHYVPMNWCLKPWIMGQPVSRTGGREVRGAETTSSVMGGERTVRWTSPFFVKCKFGCLQYVLLKFISSIAVCFLELYGLYKEGDFTTRGGYLYIIMVTNLSQCWALYCLVIFYYATKNELGPIRPVGKFLSVKALVFFTWWQSLGIAILVEMELMPSYDIDNMAPEDVAKGLQAYLICIEMFIGAIVHMFVFPHTDYLKPIAISTTSGQSSYGNIRRLGRHGMRNWNTDKNLRNKRGDAPGVNLEYLESQQHFQESNEDDIAMKTNRLSSSEFSESDDITDSSTVSTRMAEEQQKTRFARALIDSFVPLDVMDNTVGIARGDFTVEKKTLLHHAAASDQYSLFAKRKAMQVRKNDNNANQAIKE